MTEPTIVRQCVSQMDHFLFEPAHAHSLPDKMQHFVSLHWLLKEAVSPAPDGFKRRMLCVASRYHDHRHS